MGCDIHMYVEYASPAALERDPERAWMGFGGRINPGRDYALFTELAGVRGTPEKGEPVAASRGLPAGLGWESRQDSRIRVVPDEDQAEEGEVNLSRALEWAKYGSKFTPLGDNPQYWIDHPDWHSHTWCNSAELEKAMRRSGKKYPLSVEYYGLLGACRAMERRGVVVRIVMWFDN